MALETLQRIGPPAKAILPELHAFADTTPDSLLRDLALRAIGTIDLESSSKKTEVQALLAKDEQQNSLRQRLESGTFTPEDLSQGLQDAMTTSLAASRLAEMGANAQDLLPALHKALAGKDEATREEILAAIRRIDPNYTVEKVPQKPVRHGSLAAKLELEMLRSAGELDQTAAASLESLIDRFRMGNTSWYTQAEVAEFTGALHKRNLRIYEAFLSKAQEADPSFERLVRQEPVY